MTTRGPLGCHEVRDQFPQESKEAAVKEVALDLEGWTGFQTGGNRGR